MSVYKIPITSAFIIFPVIAFVLTLPYLIYQYRKYGSIPFLRSAIFYSFILYLLCTYFLVILPLPSIEEVSALTTPTIQLTPFNFINDLSNISFNWTDLSSYMNMIQSPAFYIVAFNILLTVPFGIYLRYYFECKWYQVLLFSFLLSLFFEVTQLTGLYGIYPRAYRLFDVDDLILNTFGGMLGFIVTPIFSLILPTRKELDEKSLKKGKRVSIFRRVLSYCIDFFFLVILVIVISILFHGTPFENYSLLLSIILYFLGLPLVKKKKTLGKIILKTQVISKNKKWKKGKIELRYFLSYILFYYQFIIVNLLEEVPTNNDILKIVINSSIILLKIYFWINVLSILFNIVKKKKEFLYEKITKTETISTIEYEEQPIEQEKEGKEDARVKKDKQEL